MNRGRTLAILLLAALTGVAVLALRAARSERPALAEPEAPHVVLITVDTLRADHVSVYGYDEPTTPRIDSLAREGFLFERAFTPMPTTGPAHASLLTSLYPPAHGVLKNGHVLRPDHAVLAETLGERGYRTAAFVSSFVLNRRFGYDRGFDTYDDDFRGADSSYQDMERWEGVEVEGAFDRRADETTSRAIAWLEEHSGDGPFFLWVHYFDPHHPYDPPAAHRARYVDDSMAPTDLERAIALYDAEVEFTDREIGRLLDALDARFPPERTLVALTADHGEGLMDHGFMGHGPVLYDETLRVPLVVRWTGRVPAGASTSRAASLLDLPPTILGLLGESEASAHPYQGEDLSPILLGRNPRRSERSLFFLRRQYESSEVPTFDVEGVVFGGGIQVEGPKQGVRLGDWKWVVASEEGTRELYDLKADPGETRNLHEERAEIAKSLDGRLTEWMKAQGELWTSSEQDVPEDVLERLRALGYVR